MHLEWCSGYDCCDDAWLAELASLGLPLAELNLDRCDFKGEGLAMFHSLTTLIVRDCDGLSMAGLAAVAGLPMLQEFDLFCGEGFRPARLQGLLGAANLERFSLHLFNTVCRSIRYLDFSVVFARKCFMCHSLYSIDYVVQGCGML